MEQKRKLSISSHFLKCIFQIFLAVFVTFLCTTAFGQAAVASSPPSDAESLQSKITRAKALAAAHNLDSAAVELGAIIASAKEDSVRDVARILLMDVYLEEADYTKAQGLLEDTFASETAKQSSGTVNYFALAGQVVNGVREHIARYRSFGFNIVDPTLPAEALNDLNKSRLLLEKVKDQAKQLSGDNERAADAIGLIEDVAAVRISMSRDAQEREQWQKEFEAARQKLAANDSRMANASMLRRENRTQTPQPAQSTVNPAVIPASASKDTSKIQPSASGASQPVPGAPGFIEVGSLTEKATHTAKPTYPQVAKTARVAGDVIVYLQVDEAGAVTRIDRSSGPKLLLSAAEDASKQWKFRPTMMDGKAVKVKGFITFRFKE